MKRTYLLFLLVLAISFFTPRYLSAQDADNKTVTLVVSGEGSTKEEATKNALRSAIEQAFGTFVSANTSVIDDELVRDEIATVTSGNIQNYKEVSSTDVDGVKNVTLQATVAIGKLVSYAQNKGMTAELAGATFAMNKKMHLLNVQNEMRAIENLKRQMLLMSNGLFDYEIKTKEPYDYDDSVRIDFSIVFKANKNTINYFSSISNVLNSLCLTESEKEEYNKAHRQIYSVYFYTVKYGPTGMPIKSLGGKDFYFRSEFSKGSIARIFVEPTLRNFAVVDNLGNNEKIKINWKEAFSERRKFLKSSGKLRTPYESYVAEHLYNIFENNVINNPKEGDVLYTLEHLHMMYSNDEIEKLQSLQVVPAENDDSETTNEKDKVIPSGVITIPSSYKGIPKIEIIGTSETMLDVIDEDLSTFCCTKVDGFIPLAPGKSCNLSYIAVYNGDVLNKENDKYYMKIADYVVYLKSENGAKKVAEGCFENTNEAQYIDLNNVHLEDKDMLILRTISAYKDRNSKEQYDKCAVSEVVGYGR